MELVPLGSEFGVEVRGIGLIDVASSDLVYRSIRASLEEHSVLLFREQEVKDDVQAAFSRAFGPLERRTIRHGRWFARPSLRSMPTAWRIFAHPHKSRRKSWMEEASS
jgi:alpha-ketoglutarate-dependent taurine dioxygenase